MKKVLMIAYTMNKGGMERQLATFLHNFDRNKIQVTLALFKNEIQYTLPSDIKIINLKKGRKFSPFFAFRLARLIATHHYDVIDCKLSTISHNIMLLCGLLGKNNLIVEVRNSGHTIVDFYIYAKKLAIFFRKQWCVICNSKRALAEAQVYLPPSIKLIYIGNGIDTSVFIKKEGLKHATDFKIGYAGRILPHKNIKTLIKAFHHFQSNTPATQLHIIGKAIDPSYYHELKGLVKQFNLTERVSFKENIEEIEKLYNSLDLFILPSLYEGTPNVLLEAMSCECICLVSRGANSDEFLPAEFTFETTNERQLFHKIENIYNMTENKKKNIRKENRETVESSYSVKRMVDQLTEVLLNYAR